MIDPRLISSGIESGRSLAGQGPPIQEMLGMKMQQNQMIMEVMKELLKTQMADVSDLRKTQWSMAIKELSNPNYDTPEERQAAYDKIMDMDISKWLGYKSILGGFGTEGEKKEKLRGMPMSGAQDILSVGTQAPENYYTTPQAKPSFMQDAGRFMGNAAMAPMKAVGAPFQAIDSLMQGLKRPGAANTGKDQYGFTIGQSYKGYKYIGNNQWQKQ